MKRSFLFLFGVLLFNALTAKAVADSDDALKAHQSQGSCRFSCIDSAVVLVRDVSCFGLRDGRIEVDEVFGGIAPYYISIDSFTWSLNNVIPEPLRAGKYSLYIRDGNNCIYTTHVEIGQPSLLTVNLKSTARNSMVKPGQPFTLTAEVTPSDVVIKNIEWRPDNRFDATFSLTEQVSISDTTTFYIAIETDRGCQASDLLTINVEQSHLYFPNVIVGGSLQNGAFTVYSDEGVSQVESLRIFDRWGTEVFSNQKFRTNDPTLGWNGKVLDKKIVSGVFSWIAIIDFLDGTQKWYNGDLTVIK